MIRKNKDFWQKHIMNWKESKLSPHKYCTENNLIRSTFMRWVEKLDTKIIPIKLDIPTSLNTKKEIIIEGHGLKITLPSDIAASLLSATIKEVGLCS